MIGNLWVTSAEHCLYIKPFDVSLFVRCLPVLLLSKQARKHANKLSMQTDARTRNKKTWTVGKDLDNTKDVDSMI